jgi:hypothetical protein
MWNHIELAPAGVCHVCKRGFCKDHFGHIVHFDPEVSTFGQAVWCLECVDKEEDEIERKYQLCVSHAKEWENWWGPIGNLIAYCIRGMKPNYIGSRSKCC